MTFWSHASFLFILSTSLFTSNHYFLSRCSQVHAFLNQNSHLSHQCILIMHFSNNLFLQRLEIYLFNRSKRFIDDALAYLFDTEWIRRLFQNCMKHLIYMTLMLTLNQERSIKNAHLKEFEQEMKQTVQQILLNICNNKTKQKMQTEHKLMFRLHFRWIDVSCLALRDWSAFKSLRKQSQWLSNDDTSIFFDKVLLKSESSICATSLTWKWKFLMKHCSALNRSFKRALSWLLRNEMNKILVRQNDEKTRLAIEKRMNWVMFTVYLTSSY